MVDKKLRAVTFLAPNMLPVYQFLIDYLSAKLNCEITLDAGSDYDAVYDYDLSFICGLPYVLYTYPRREFSLIEALAAPVLKGSRYQNRPIYFSDVIVHRESRFHTFADLRGASWAYNEPLSQSGYGITRCHLVQLGETSGFFGQVIHAGFHQEAIRMVYTRQIDAAAIDSQVLAVELRCHPWLADQLRVIDTFGPSTIQPFTAACHLPESLKQDIQSLLLDVHHDPTGAALLDHGFIDHFTAVQDSDYDDIRHMLAACEEAQFLTLK